MPGSCPRRKLADAEPAEIQSILGGDEAFANAVVDAADAVVEALIMEEAERRNAPPVDDAAPFEE